MQALKFSGQKYFALSAFFLGLYCFCVSQFKFISVPVCFFNSPKFENSLRLSEGTQFIGKTPKFCDLLEILLVGIKIPQGFFSLCKSFVFINRHNRSMNV
jgi:hypothetical protein